MDGSESNPAAVDWGLVKGQSPAAVDHRQVEGRWRESLGRSEGRQYSPDAGYQTQSSIVADYCHPS